MKFSKNFLWGVANSATQTESFNQTEFKSQSTWDYWYQIDPLKFHNSIGPDNTNDSYQFFNDDIECIKKLNLNSFRTSISWTRLLPDGKNLNQKAVNFYLRFFQKIKEQNIKLFVCLFHFDLPMFMMQKGGWINHIVIEQFKFYAKKAFELFGYLVDYWITFNEPIVHVECSYLNQCHYPAEINWQKAIIAGWHTLLAHKAAVSEFKKLNLKSQIGIILVLGPVYSKSQEPNDLIAKQHFWLLHVDFILRACVSNSINPELINLLKKNNLLNFTISNADWELISNYPIDFLGVNYYQPFRVQKSSNNLFPNYEYYEKPNKRINPSRKWEIYPEGIYDLAMDLQKNYPNLSWILTETGFGHHGEDVMYQKNLIINDQYRINFYQEHLDQLKKAIVSGARCFGCHFWTLIDCWSWLNGYKNRYGFYYLNLITKERIIKKSGLWLQTFLANEKK